MVNLIIQIPCFNEESFLQATLQSLPGQLLGIDEIRVWVIDDGSTDNTAAIARQAGAEVIALQSHQGLAAAFAAGLKEAKEAKVDILVNTDADGQYRGEDIVRLIAPILKGEADIVIGNRDIEAIEHFSPLKKFLQRLGSWAVKHLSGLDIPDATTGFRAYSQKAIAHLEVRTDFSYTLETIVAAGRKGLKVANIIVKTNPPRRPSRLAHSTGEYVFKQFITLIRVCFIYGVIRRSEG